MKILIINAGSSSLKYQFMESEGGEVFAKGLCERIGIDGRLTHKVPGREDPSRSIRRGWRRYTPWGAWSYGKRYRRQPPGGSWA